MAWWWNSWTSPARTLLLAAGERFSLADCAAAPALFNADWTHPVGGDYPNVTTYRARLLARPSYARAVDAARRFRHYFPLGAPAGDRGERKRALADVESGPRRSS